ncbi:hypothetical protein [Leisingera sp. MMG026]|uniref:O-linked N-acetylglucosamine transferase, SPINDLY family protein n=1 Tax=Leisingera sp. MMG026 TaxID=2909982 RepID=UPI001F2BFC08|nr:hypothetical protein [Leisingera sp. MMG026]MCF6433199.1 hypothetical protein [Leisingera sp. MMG026]
MRRKLRNFGDTLFQTDSMQVNPAGRIPKGVLSVSNSGAQHFLASEAIAKSNKKLPEVLPGNARAALALGIRHGMVQQTEGTPEAQAMALYDRARKFALKRQYRDAEYLLRQALELDGKNRKIHAALGETLEMTNQHSKALLVHLDALRLDPSDSNSMSYIGSYLMRLHQDEEAINYFEAAYQFDPKNATAFARMLFLQRRRCDWTHLANLDKKLKLLKETQAVVDPFASLSVVDDPELQKKLSVKVAMTHKTVAGDVEFARPRANGRKIRLGYFSSDFFDHATMFLIGRQFEMHNRERFEIYIYDYGRDRDQEGKRRAEKAADTYRHVADKENNEIAEIARMDGLDIAVDLKGYTRDNRLNIFNERLAPVHVTYLGYPGTCGVKEMDYMVADPVTIPAQLRKHYTEKILYMPDCYQPNDDKRSASANKPSRSDVGLPEDAFVFCSFNSPYKVSPEEFDIWMKLLKKVPSSVLWFYCNEGGAQKNIVKEAKKRGVPADRIVFAGFADQSDHLARLPLADIFLDTFAVNAHTTASDALWAGVPVVTKIGKQFAARVAASLLHNVGMQELVASSPQKYQALALKLARDQKYLADVKARVKQGIAEGPLYDTQKFTRNFEALMEKTLERVNAGLKPEHISLT